MIRIILSDLLFQYCYYDDDTGEEESKSLDTMRYMQWDAREKKLNYANRALRRWPTERVKEIEK